MGQLTLPFYRHAGFIYPVFVILLAHFVILSNLLSFYRFYPFCHFIDRCHYSDKHHFVILSLRSFRRCLRCVLPPAGAVCCALHIPFGCAGALGWWRAAREMIWEYCMCYRIDTEHTPIHLGRWTLWYDHDNECMGVCGRRSGGTGQRGQLQNKTMGSYSYG